MTNASHWPPEIADAVCKIMAKRLTATRGEHDTNGDGRAYSWASVDDIFEAVSPDMAEAGLISEMITVGTPEWISMFDIAQGCERPALSMTFRFQITNKKGECYADAENLWPVVAWFEGMTTTASARSHAHKQALRDLFKIKTVDKDIAAQQARDTQQAPATTRTAASKVLKPKVPTNPLMLSDEASTAKADEIIRKLEKAAKNKESDEREMAVKNAFRANAGGIGRLRPADTVRVTEAHNALVNGEELADQ